MNKNLDYQEKISELIETEPNNPASWQTKGEILLKKSLFYDAMKCFTRSIILEPSNENAWRGKGLISIFFDVTNDALQCFDKALSLKQNDTETFRLKSHAYPFNKINHSKIKNCLSKALELEPENKSVLLSNALFFEKDGNEKEALSFFEKVLSKDPNNLIALLHKTKILNKEESFFSLIKSFQNKTDFDLTKPTDLNELGNEFLLQFDLVNANVCFKKILVSDSNNASIIFKCGLIFLMKRDLNKSLELIDLSLKIAENNSLAWTRKGEILRRLNKITEAIECFDKAIKKDDQNAEAWRRKGFTQSMRHEKLDEIIFCLDKSLKLDPWHPMTLVQKAIFLSRSKETWEKSFLCLDTAIKSDPSFILAWKVKSQLYTSKNDFENAFSCYEKILELESDDVESWYNFGVMKAKHAESEYQKGLELFNKSKYDDALECFDKVLTIDANDSETLVLKAKSFESLKRKEEAIEFYKKASELAPKNIEIQNKIKSLDN